ncbi:DUF7305 domain-containing protein [Rhodoplanes sp. Z2-YC6860]|uniref:DUF7305 domain-containing protein n=1 Tax=Rhodoplanes sp. Z2-YC6860 TaxID=674703 RepID=UPI00078EB6E4|nr:pilus assembly protein TadG-related protein [Rhodoplanes sp. Z2-YC6860]AMN43698.1 Flp pilus assembly protein TadG [Rhodoplanes sp. Z2-YC6860]
MRNLLRSHEGSVSFAAVVALVPLIGVMSLGTEAAIWYVTKQQAQAAADAAAYSGGLKLACTLAGSSCTDAQSIDYRGKQFAAQNAFCNAGDSSYPGARCTSVTGVTRTVAISSTTDSVTATVGQQQPAYLSSVLGFSTINIGATATAQVIVLANPCALSLSSPIAFQGSATISAPNCGLASNSTASNSVDFKGNALDLSNVKTVSGAGGCQQTGGSPCSKAITYAPPAPNPLSGLDAAISSLVKADFTGGNRTGNSIGSCTAFMPYGSGSSACYNTLTNWGSMALTSGVYFITGDVKISGSVTITGTNVTLIFMPPKFINNGDKGATLTITGNPTIQLTAPSTVTASQVPTKLATTSVLSLMSKLLIYDPETTTGNQTVSFSGSSATYFSGITYAPNASVTYQGSTQSSACTELIAKGITLSGNSNFDNSGCPSSVKIASQIVKLVQ